MNHTRVLSSNIHSIGHHGNILEVHFKCGKCKGEGFTVRTSATGAERRDGCSACHNTGHTGTYRYSPVSAEKHADILAGRSGDAEKSSVGSAFHRLVRLNPDVKVEKP